MCSVFRLFWLCCQYRYLPGDWRINQALFVLSLSTVFLCMLTAQATFKLQLNRSYIVTDLERLAPAFSRWLWTWSTGAKRASRRRTAVPSAEQSVSTSAPGRGTGQETVPSRRSAAPRPTSSCKPAHHGHQIAQLDCPNSKTIFVF